MNGVDITRLPILPTYRNGTLNDPLHSYLSYCPSRILSTAYLIRPRPSTRQRIIKLTIPLLLRVPCNAITSNALLVKSHARPGPLRGYDLLAVRPRR